MQISKDVKNAKEIVNMIYEGYDKIADGISIENLKEWLRKECDKYEFDYDEALLLLGLSDM